MRAHEIRYLGFGFGIGAAITSLAIVAFFLMPRIGASILITPMTFPPSPAITSTAMPPASIYTNTPTLLPYATPPRQPTITPSTTELMIASGEIVVIGPLNRQQTISLYDASVSFVAPTYQESKVVSAEINRQQFSDPSTTCGPLSIAILQASGLLGNHIIPHDFFLLNPDNGPDREILDRTFPEELFTQVRYKIKLNKVNWSEGPLFPGDFVYIYMGTGGNFEHMLVVNRVDLGGRAYSVTNYNTENGFIINEVLLYDPGNPKAGIFIQWTQRENQLLGSTGFAGYEVWRLKENTP